MMLGLTYHIIDERYNAELPMVVTTNYTMEGLWLRLTVGKNDITAQAIVSRLYEMCGGAPYFIEGGDRRSKKHE